LLEVIELLEGVIQEKHCRMDEKNCPFKECVFGGLPEKLTREFKEYFGKTRISDIKKKSEV
jgi:DNA-binding IscR family transcriptional regulator